MVIDVLTVKQKLEEVLNQNLSTLIQAEQLGVYNDVIAQRKGFCSGLQWVKEELLTEKNP